MGKAFIDLAVYIAAVIIGGNTLYRIIKLVKQYDKTICIVYVDTLINTIVFSWILALKNLRV